MTAEHTDGGEPLIPMPALTLDALRRAVATVAPSRLPEFFQEIQDAFSQAGDEDRLAEELTARESMIFLDGRGFTGDPWAMG